MKIHIATAVGSGPTELAAFDAALAAAGVANYNLLYLSSVIPPASDLVLHDGAIPGGTIGGGWGDRLYLVKSDARASRPGEQVWSAIGWVQDEVSGKGLFVEHSGSDEGAVRKDVEQSLQALTTTRGIDLGPTRMTVSGTTCADQCVCALTVAVYQSQAWDRDGDGESGGTSAPRSGGAGARHA